MKTICLIVKKTGTGISAYANDFDALPVSTTGASIIELKQNILKAANLYLEHVSKKTITIERIVVNFNIPSFFKYYDVINAKLSANVSV